MKDPYTYNGTDILINNLNIKDKELLSTTESMYYRCAVDYGLPSGNFDFNHLKNIHKAFFGELYPFAGEIRTVNLSKSDTMFCSHNYIEQEANKLFNKLKQENYLSNYKDEQLIVKLADYFSEINAIHPFREGNGRTNREFIIQLAKHNNLELNFINVNREEYITASIHGWHGDNSLMEKVIAKCITHNEQDLITNKYILDYYNQIDPDLITKVKSNKYIELNVGPGVEPRILQIENKHHPEYVCSPEELAQALGQRTGHKKDFGLSNQLTINKEIDTYKDIYL